MIMQDLKKKHLTLHSPTSLTLQNKQMMSTGIEHGMSLIPRKTN